MTGEPLRVALCDDSGIFRDGLRLLLEAVGVTVTASVADVPSLFRSVDDTRPDVVVLDVRMPPTHTDEGIRAAVELRRRSPETGILVLSTYVDPPSAVTLLAAVPDSAGYLLKDRVGDVGILLGALRRVAAVFRTLGLESSSSENRRVKAALAYLGTARHQSLDLR